MDYSEADIELELIEGTALSDLNILFLGEQVRTEFGIIDILGFNTANNKITVIELKKGTVDENAVGQIMRYIAAMEDIWEAQSREELWSRVTGVEGLLIGGSCTSGVEQIVRKFDFLSYLEHNIKIEIKLYETVNPDRPEQFVDKDIKNIKKTDVVAYLHDILCHDEIRDIILSKIGG